jgi:hypothetical protein
MHFYGAAFDRRSLEKELLASDYKKDPNLTNDAYRGPILIAAQAQAKAGFGALHLSIGSSKNAKLYKCNRLEQDLVVRRLSRNVKRFIRRRSTDRETIIKSLRAVLADGHAYRVYKLDIQRFYESIDTKQIATKLANEMAFPTASAKVFNFFADELVRQGIPGLPRGMSISATLSEYLMQDVDAAIKAEPEVYFYARYVDDIVIVTTGEENRKTFYRKLQRNLPRGLEFNRGKCRVVPFFRRVVNRHANGTPEDTLDFLGYRFTVHGQTKEENEVRRKVFLDISPKKIRRLKTRICLACLQFFKDGHYRDLKDRISLISLNYNLYDTDKNIRRNVGLYWNYRFIDAPQSIGLPELDQFLKSLLLSKHGKLVAGLNAKLSSAQRDELLSVSFAKSFRAKTFRHFSAGRLAHLAGCWAYE